MNLSSRDAFELAVALAARLEAAVPSQELHRAAFVPIPRGGHFALGLLSYALRLGRDPVRPPDLTILVDDCACSGARLASALRRLAAPRIVVALLAAPPSLVRNLLAREPRVEHCLVGRELAEAAGALDPSHPFAAAIRDGARFAAGAGEPVVFPWGEAEQPVWNRTTGEMEEGYRQAPPHLCPGNWAALGLPARIVERTYLLAPGVRYRLGEVEDRAVTPDGQLLGFSDSARALWRSLLAYGNVAPAAEGLAATCDAPRQQVEADAAAFVERLLSAGLIVRAEQP